MDFPDLKCATSGVNDDDALLSARELLGCVLYGLEEDAEEIPAPTPLTEVDTQPNERVVLVDVYMPSIRQAHVNRSVNRTVTLPAWLNAAALEHNIVFLFISYSRFKISPMSPNYLLSLSELSADETKVSSSKKQFFI